MQDARAREAQNYGYFGISFYYVQIGSFHPAYFIVQHQQYNDSASGSLRAASLLRRAGASDATLPGSRYGYFFQIRAPTTASPAA